MEVSMKKARRKYRMIDRLQLSKAFYSVITDPKESSAQIYVCVFLPVNQ